MQFLYLFFMFLMLGMLSDTPMYLLVSILVSMMFSILYMFEMYNDYWTMYIMILSFLVGLFMLFLYLVSLSSANESLKNKIMNFKNMYMLLFLSALYYYVWTYKSMYYKTSDFMAISWYEWMYESKNEMLILSMFFFSLCVMIVFFFSKKNKKMMKSSM